MWPASTPKHSTGSASSATSSTSSGAVGYAEDGAVRCQRNPLPLIDPAWVILAVSRITTGRRHEARGHAQAAGGGARGAPAAGDRAAADRHDLRRDRGAGRADSDRGVRRLQTLCPAGCSWAEDGAAARARAGHRSAPGAPTWTRWRRADRRDGPGGRCSTATPKTAGTWRPTSGSRRRPSPAGRANATRASAKRANSWRAACWSSSPGARCATTPARPGGLQVGLLECL
jgi:hypothetical protein